MNQTLLVFAVATLAALCASCSVSNRYEDNYTRLVGLGKTKPIPASQVAVEEFSDESALKARITSLRHQGYVMVGHSLFDGEYAPPVSAKTFAAKEGCERVLIIRRKIGQGVGTRMETASYSPPSMGFVNTTLYTPSGRSYSAATTIFNPAQSTHVARDYVYDYYRQGAAFFTRQDGLANRSKQ